MKKPFNFIKPIICPIFQEFAMVFQEVVHVIPKNIYNTPIQIHILPDSNVFRFHKCGLEYAVVKYDDYK